MLFNNTGFASWMFTSNNSDVLKGAMLTILDFITLALGNSLMVTGCGIPWKIKKIGLQKPVTWGLHV